MKIPMVTMWKGWRMDAGGGATLLALTAAVYFMGFAPLIHRQDQNRADEQQIEIQRNKVAQGRAALTSLRGQIEQMERAVAQSPVRLEPARVVNQRLAKLTELSSQCGLRIDEIKPGQGSVGSWYEAVPIHIAGSGSYRTCAQFLHQLRQMFPDTRVSALELTGQPGSEPSVAKVRLDLVWYASAPKAASAQ